MTPLISVVVATHNRAARLHALLSALEHQTLDSSSFEVVIVDDGSADETGTVVEERVATSLLSLITRRNAVPEGPASAREKGWRASKSEFIAFTDDDCEPSASWLEDGLARLNVQESVSFIQGRTEPAPGERDRLGPFARTIEVSALDAGFQTCNIFYPRHLLEEIDGFDTIEFDRSPGGEDADLAWRAIEHGARPIFATEVLVYHAVNELGPLGKLRVAARWTTPMKAYVRHPGLRDAHFVKRVFWKGSHYLLARAAVALITPRQLRWLTPWLVLPYLFELERRRRLEAGAPWILAYYVVHDLVECWAILRAAFRYRHPML